MKLFIRSPMEEKWRSQLKNYFDEIVYSPWTATGERYYEDEMLEALKKYQPDVLITELDRITEKVLNGYGKLKVIGDCRGNPANIDVGACTKHNIPVLCTPARNAQAVAEMLVGLLINFMRNVIPSVQWIKDGKWVKGTTPYYIWMGNELQYKKVGIVGFGAVGRKVAHLLNAFDCDISFYDPYVEEDKALPFKKASLENIFSQSDIVSIHLPVLDSTKGMINEKLLSMMKPSGIFVNTARTAVVDMDALAKALKEKKIRGAVLDVLDAEPPTPESLKIAQYPNVLLTPHICGASYEVTDHQSDIIIDRLAKWFKKEDLASIVFNKEVLK